MVASSQVDLGMPNRPLQHCFVTVTVLSTTCLVIVAVWKNRVGKWHHSHLTIQTLGLTQIYYSGYGNGT